MVSYEHPNPVHAHASHSDQVVTLNQPSANSNESADSKRIYAVRKQDLETRSLHRGEPRGDQTQMKEVIRGYRGESTLREVPSMPGYKAMFFRIPGGGASILQLEFIEDIMDMILHS